MNHWEGKYTIIEYLPGEGTAAQIFKFILKKFNGVLLIS